jgi:hypothetical protein
MHEPQPKVEQHKQDKFTEKPALSVETHLKIIDVQTQEQIVNKRA